MFRQVVLPLKDKLLRVALRITLCQEDAEDIVQETLLRLWRQTEQGTPIDNAEALAVTICRNLSLDLVARHEQRNVSLDTQQHDHPDTDRSPHDRLEADERRERIEQLINQLPEKQRTALSLRDIEGHPYKEIARMMQISEADVKVNIFRARQRLRALILQSPNP